MTQPGLTTWSLLFGMGLLGAIVAAEVIPAVPADRSPLRGSLVARSSLTRYDALLNTPGDCHIPTSWCADDDSVEPVTPTPAADPRALLASAGRINGDEAGAVSVGEDATEEIPRETRPRLISKGKSLEAQGRLNEAQICFEKLVGRDSQDAEALCRLAKVCLYLKDYERAHDLLQQVRELGTRYALADAVEGLYMFCLRDTAGALESLDRALKANPALREGYLIKADILFAIRDLDAAGKLLDQFLARSPSDPEGLYLSGIVHFYRKDLARAQVLLEESLKLNRRALNVRKDLVQVYSLTGRPEKALGLLEELLSERPTDKALAALRSGLKDRLRLKRDGKVLVHEPFRFLYPRDTKPSTLETIVQTFTAALAELSSRHSTGPRRVNVTILHATDQLLPAYYNHVSDEITISRQYYEGLNTQRKMELGKHLIFHEFSHLALYQELGNISLPPAALWLVEGLAEYEAGGYTYTHVDFDVTFADGLFELESLEEYLPVSAMGKGKAREKAYIQSYAMAAYILESMGQVQGLALIKKMAMAYTRLGPDHDKVLAEGLGVTPKQFLAACDAFIHRRLARLETDTVPQ